MIAIGLVTWNAAADVERCIASVRAQIPKSPAAAPPATSWDIVPPGSPPPRPGITLLVVDNASTDGTREVVERLTSPHERLWLDRNVGFSAAHNMAIARTRGTYYLSLNPDVFLAPDFLARLTAALDDDGRAGAATGKLVRADNPDTIDTTGMYLVPSQRHLDRGAGERDRGQYDRLEYVFGASGAAALYRRAMLDDVRIAGEVFDEDFFAYREDADLAWRAQLLGWRCLYVPDAVARHVRRVTPERRATLPPTINRYSVRNRFLLRLKNQTPGEALRFALPALLRDVQVVGYVMTREWRSLPGLLDVVRLLPRTWSKRRAIMRRRRASATRWFRQAAEASVSSQKSC